jgi:transglutaminase-like putative cysteine protease
LLAAGLAAPGVPVVAGHSQVDYSLGEALTLPNYRNNGFVQHGGSGAVTVRVVLDPDFTRASFPALIADPEALTTLAGLAGPPVEIAQFARRAVAGSRTQEQAVVRLMDAIRRRVDYDRDALGTESALEAYQSGRSYCVGLANLAAAALSSLGIPARTVRGLLLDAEHVPRAHRWIEVYYPDAGWVFSDPTASTNFVDAGHLVLRPPGAGEDGYDPGPFVIARPVARARHGALLVVDRAPVGGLLMRRRNHPIQWTPTVAGYAPGVAAGTPVRLVGAGRQFLTNLGTDRSFSFSGLRPGTYTLIVDAADGGPRVIRVQLEPSGLRTLVLRDGGS